MNILIVKIKYPMTSHVNPGDVSVISIINEFLNFVFHWILKNLIEYKINMNNNNQRSVKELDFYHTYEIVKNN